MGTHDTKEKQSAKSGAGGSQNKPSISMSTNDHTNFVDLLLQRAAQSATAAMGMVDPKAQFDATAQAVARVDAALAGYTVPETGTNPQQLFRSVDGAFMALYDLFYDVQASEDIWLKASAVNVKRVMTELNSRFSLVGWKAPKSAAEGDVRAKVADKAGATVLTTAEKGQLGRLHLQAARQYVLGSWEQIVSGNLAAVAIASHNVADAMGLLVDPHLSTEMAAITGEIMATEEVISRLVVTIEERNGSKLTALRDLAKQLDGLLKLVGKDPRWSKRIEPHEPTGSNDSTTTKDEKGAPSGRAPDSRRVEPPMHQPLEQRVWVHKVHIKDTNYFDEYLGHIALEFIVNKAPSGQIYIQSAVARDHLVGRGNDFLSMGADVSAVSMDMNGQLFADVFFDVKIGGPNVTKTTAVGLSVKGSASPDEKKTEGVEVGASVTFSSSTSSQGTRSFRRAFRVSSLSTPKKILDTDPMTGKQREVETGMSSEERLDMHEDFDNFELDDDDVGDELTSFYANWVLHSYSD